MSGVTPKRSVDFHPDAGLSSRRGSHRLAVQDVALSRRKQGFESPWERH
jgi:hypothetical protein